MRRFGPTHSAASRSAAHDGEHGRRARTPKRSRGEWMQMKSTPALELGRLAARCGVHHACPRLEPPGRRNDARTACRGVQWRRARVARERSAKPRTRVRFPSSPPHCEHESPLLRGMHWLCQIALLTGEGRTAVRGAVRPSAGVAASGMPRGYVGWTLRRRKAADLARGPRRPAAGPTETAGYPPSKPACHP